MESLDLLAAAAFSPVAQEAAESEGHEEYEDGSQAGVKRKRRPSTEATEAMPAFVPSHVEPQQQLSFSSILMQEQMQSESMPTSHLLPEDNVLIRCVCAYDDDDGFTIQCDRCYAWLHGLCVGIEPGSDVPDTFLCDLCKGIPTSIIDRMAATEKQNVRRKELQRLQAEEDAALLALSQMPPLPIPIQTPQSTAPKTKRKPKQDTSRPPVPIVSKEVVKSPVISTAPLQPTAKRKRSGKHTKQNQSLSLPPISTIVSETITTSTTSNVLAPITQTQTQTLSQTVETATPAPVPETPAPPPPITRRSVNGPSQIHTVQPPQTPSQNFDEEAIDDKFEAWQFEYTPTNKLLWDDPTAIESCRIALKHWFDLNANTELEDDFAKEEKSDFVHEVYFNRAQRSRNIKWTRRKWQKGQEPKSTLLNSTNPFADYDAQRDLGLQAPLGVLETNSLPSASRIMVKSLPPAAFNFAPPQSALFSTASSTTPSASCPYPRAAQYAVFASTSIQAGAYVAPIHGQVTSLERYQSFAANQYDVIGVPKPHVRAFTMPWSVVVDQRMYGSDSRFARSGCHPNAIVRPIVHRLKPVDNSKISEEAFQFEFGIFALTDISKREEIVLPWDWDDHHIIHVLPALLSLSTSSIDTLLPTSYMSKMMAKVASTLLGITSCACERRKDCGLGWFWKMASASQPTHPGGTNKREMEDDENIESRMAVALTSAAAGFLPIQGARKGQNKQIKQPSLGPLLSVKRGWYDLSSDESKSIADVSVNEVLDKREGSVELPPNIASAESPATIDALEAPAAEADTTAGTSFADSSLTAMDVERQAVVDEQEHRALASLFDDPPVPPPSLQVDAPEGDQDRVESKGASESEEQQVAGMSMAPPLDVQQPVTDNVPESPPPSSTTELAQPARVDSESAVKEDVSEKAPTPPPRVPTPPVPRAKLSFAAYRKRMSERKPEPAPIDTSQPLGGDMEKASNSAMLTSSSAMDTSTTLNEGSAPLQPVQQTQALPDYKPESQTPGPQQGTETSMYTSKTMVETPAAVESSQSTSYFPSVSSFLGMSCSRVSRFSSPAPESTPLVSMPETKAALPPSITASVPGQSYFPSPAPFQFHTTGIADRFRSPTLERANSPPREDLTRAPNFGEAQKEEPPKYMRGRSPTPLSPPLIRGRSPTPPKSPLNASLIGTRRIEEAEHSSTARNGWQAHRQRSPRSGSPPNASTNDHANRSQGVGRGYYRNRSPPRGPRGFTSSRDSSSSYYRPRGDSHPYRGPSRGFPPRGARVRGRGWGSRARGH